MGDEKDQIVAYLRHRARRYAGALGAPDESDEPCPFAATLNCLSVTLKECADAIERGDHREENEE